MKKRYEDTDLYTMEHPDLRHHARMPISERAAQFLPFSALSGYEESLAEEERQTEKRKILVPEEKEKIRIRLTRISCGEKKDVEILYFEEDERKKPLISY